MRHEWNDYQLSPSPPSLKDRRLTLEPESPIFMGLKVSGLQDLQSRIPIRNLIISILKS